MSGEKMSEPERPLALWRVLAEQFAEDQAQIEPCHMHQRPLENVVMLAQIPALHPAHVIAVRVAAFCRLAAPSQ